MAFYRKAKAEPQWRLVYAKQNILLILVRQPRRQFWILGHLPIGVWSTILGDFSLQVPVQFCSGKKSSFERSLTRLNRLLASMGGLGFFDSLGEFSLGRQCQLHRSF